MPFCKHVVLGVTLRLQCNQPWPARSTWAKQDWSSFVCLDKGGWGNACVPKFCTKDFAKVYKGRGNDNVQQFISERTTAHYKFNMVKKNNKENHYDPNHDREIERLRRERARLMDMLEVSNICMYRSLFANLFMHYQNCHSQK